MNKSEQSTGGHSIPAKCNEPSTSNANPERIWGFVCKVESTSLLGNRGLLAIALALAYFIGTWFVLWVSLFQWGTRGLSSPRKGISNKSKRGGVRCAVEHVVRRALDSAPQLVRGDMVGMALHATGWSGLSALVFAPNLRNPYYVAFSLFFVIFGLLADRSLAKRLFDPRQSGVLRLRAVLAELWQVESTDEPQRKLTVTGAPQGNQPAVG